MTLSAVIDFLEFAALLAGAAAMTVLGLAAAAGGG